MIEYIVVGTLVGLAGLGGIIKWFEDRKKKKRYANELVDF